MNNRLVMAAALEGAVGVLKTHGWCQGRAQDDQGRVCAGMALNMVVRDLITTSEVESLLAQSNRQIMMGGIPFWNDLPECTKEEVIATFLSAAAILRAQEGANNAQVADGQVVRAHEGHNELGALSIVADTQRSDAPAREDGEVQGTGGWRLRTIDEIEGLDERCGPELCSAC